MMTRPIGGVASLVKPPGMSSHDVVSFARRVLGIRKVGHSGTLDPGAAGVLVVGVGQGTRILEYLLDLPKAYRAEMTLGVATETGDAFGSVVSECEAGSIGVEDVRAVAGEFLGPLSQVPPMTSALKHKGKPLYRLARQGKSVERKPRPVTIYDLKVVSFEPDGQHPRAILDIRCSKGTYIRTLIQDIGKELGCGAHMSFLIRQAVGCFRLTDALSLREFELGVTSGGGPGQVLIGAAEALQFLPAYVLRPGEVERVTHGIPPDSQALERRLPGEGVEWGHLDGGVNKEGEIVRLLDEDFRLVATGKEKQLVMDAHGGQRRLVTLEKVFPPLEED